MGTPISKADEMISTIFVVSAVNQIISECEAPRSWAQSRLRRGASRGCGSNTPTAGSRLQARFGQCFHQSDPKSKTDPTDETRADIGTRAQNCRATVFGTVDLAVPKRSVSGRSQQSPAKKSGSGRSRLGRIL